MKARLVTLLILFTTLYSCSKEVYSFDHSNHNQLIFNEFWTFVDEHYIFFDSKNIDWESVKEKYEGQISPELSEEELFEICEDALTELKDAHSRLESKFAKSKNYNIREGYEIHFSPYVVRDQYAGGEWTRTGNIFHSILDNDIGYIYIAFMSKYEELINIIKNMEQNKVKGIVIDIRNNPGGDSNPLPDILGHFVKEPTPLGYYVEKSGPRHDDITDPLSVNSKPKRDSYIELPISLLINRSSYSAASYMAAMCKEIKNFTIVGQITGGGAGGNYGYELSNGWILAVSVSDFLDTDFESIELGVEPDLKIENSKEDIENGKDRMLENAIEIIMNN